MKNRRRAGLLTITLIVASGTAVWAAASPLTIRFGHVIDDKSSLQAGAEKFAEALAAKSKGAIKVEIFPNSQLGGNREMLESLQVGVLEIVSPAVAFLGGFNDKTKLLDLPYLFKDNATAEAVLDGAIGDELFKGLDDKGFVGLGWWAQGWRHATTTNREVRKPSDMKGIKIRVMENELHIEHFAALGASPIPMAYSEVLTSLQQGVIDAQENPYQNIKQAGFFEVQKYIIETGHIYDPIPVLYSKVLWDGLSAEQQKWIREAARESVAFQRKLTNDLEESIRKEIAAVGKNVVVRLTPEERAEFRKAAQPVYDKWAPRFGDMVARIQGGR
jgi:tripartite ATP-independent transporter DctP family solute receptor